MRLPQSSRSSLCFYFLFVIVLVMLPLPQAGAVAQQLTSSPAALRFGTVTIGQTEDQLLALTNNGQTAVTVSGTSATSSEFSISGLSLPKVIPAGQSVVFSVVFAPNAAGWTSGRISFTSDASNKSYSLQVGGAGVTKEAVIASPGSLAFGKVAVGKSATLPLTLTNNEPWKQTINSFQVSGTGYSVSGATAPLTLAPGESVTLQVIFNPQGEGLTGGGVFVSGPALNVPCNGTGTAVGQLSLSPASLNFGSVELGTTATQGSTFTAAGGSVTISSAASSNSQYGVTGVSFPLTINSGQSVSFSVSFAPKTTGKSSAKLTFSSDASGSNIQESLVGNGTNPSITLSWNASTSQVSGYNLYRGTTAGVYAKLNSILDPGTSYTDTTVTPGTKYYYVATAVDASGRESAYSTPVAVTVP